MTRHTQPEPLLDASVRLDNLPPEGRTIKVGLDPANLPAIAELLKVTAVSGVGGTLKAVRFRGGIRVEGQVQATIVQPCVVTLEPVTQAIDEPYDRIFLPASQVPRREPVAGAEVLVDLDQDELPDHFEGSDVDLTDSVLETIALAIDPYPRAPGASLDDLGADLLDREESPFASLKTLKIDPDKA